MSLFEVSLVAAVCVSIGTGAVVAAGPRCLESKTQRARAELVALELAAEANNTVLNGCPTIDTLIADQSLRPDTPRNDPWDRPYIIACDTTLARARSAGEDGVLGTRDDP